MGTIGRWLCYGAGGGSKSALPLITRNRLRVMNKWFFWLWIFPGILISIYLRNSVAWVVFLSVYAIIVAYLIEWRQED